MSIEVKDLVKLYGTQRALDGVSFQVNKGEILGFLGPNGAGKSTTMKIITGLIDADSGSASVCGFDVRKQGFEARRRLGYLAEQNPLYTDMYVKEFLSFTGALSGLSGKTLQNRVPEMIELTGLGREQHKKISALSKGYKQRVGIAQALMHDPEVLILDEPTSGLDPNQLVEIRNLIRNLGKDRTLIFSSHILPEVQAVADRIMIIHQGKIVADTPMEHRNTPGSSVLLSVEFEPGKVFDTSTLTANFEGLVITAVSTEQLSIQCPAHIDIRKALYAESVRQEIAILSMQKSEGNLEDTFRALTNAKTKEA
jgi:ABC-2 type transport system ATP-binding protein